MCFGLDMKGPSGIEPGDAAPDFNLKNANFTKKNEIDLPAVFEFKTKMFESQQKDV